MPDSSLWDRYHHLLQEYIAHGDERQLREVVALSQEKGLTLETTSGRVAASVRSVLSAYASVGAESMEVNIERRRQSHEELRRTHAAPVDGAGGDRLVTLTTPEHGGDTVLIEVRGRCPDKDLPIVRLDYVTAKAEGHSEPFSPVDEPIEPRQLYDVLVALLGRDPDPPNHDSVHPS